MHLVLLTRIINLFYVCPTTCSTVSSHFNAYLFSLLSHVLSETFMRHKSSSYTLSFLTIMQKFLRQCVNIAHTVLLLHPLSLLLRLYMSLCVPSLFTTTPHTLKIPHHTSRIHILSEKCTVGFEKSPLRLHVNRQRFFNL